MPTNSDMFKKYKGNCKIHVESGSHVGHGIQAALDAGFEGVHSIELAPHFYAYCQKRFDGDNRVHLHLGDSSVVLKEILNSISESCLFFLDGHYSGDNTSLGSKYSPLMDELEIIKNHRTKNHTILIDDLRCFTVQDINYGFDTNTLMYKILEINPNYKFILEDSYRDGQVLFEKDILVAVVGE